jgi:Ca-activated chloride channel family protein
MKKQRRTRKKGKFVLIFIFILGFILGYATTGILLLNRENATRITIVYSSEKASWMSIAYVDFLNEWNTKHPDEPIIVDMQAYGSADSVISILNGEIYPTIWSPASSIWMPFLNAKWAQLNPHKGLIVNISAAMKLIYSPIVIATWENFNKTYDIKGFHDLYDLILNPNVDIKMAHTDPRLSNSGFMSVIMELKAASGLNPENFTMVDLSNSTNQNWLRVIESSAVMYGTSTGFLARYMVSGGPNTLNIVFLYENLIKDISNSVPGNKIIAIYPEEGTLYSDHPFCILNGDWISPNQRIVAQAFLDFLNEPATLQSAISYGFRPINASIPIDPGLLNEVFNYDNSGISYNITVPELHVPNDGEVLLNIPDLWLLCKSIG